MYQFRWTFFAINIFWSIQFLKHFFYNDAKFLTTRLKVSESQIKKNLELIFEQKSTNDGTIIF